MEGDGTKWAHTCNPLNKEIMLTQKRTETPEDGVYVGEIKSDQRNGKRKMQYGLNHVFKGAVYEGEWKNNRPNGQGTLKYSQEYGGAVFEGEFVNGKRHLGILYFADGRALLGRWEEGNRLYNNKLHMIGEGVEWSKDRRTAWRLLDGHHCGLMPRENNVEVDSFDAITLPDAADAGGVVNSAVKVFGLWGLFTRSYFCSGIDVTQTIIRDSKNAERPLGHDEECQEGTGYDPKFTLNYDATFETLDVDEVSVGGLRVYHGLNIMLGGLPSFFDTAWVLPAQIVNCSCSGNRNPWPGGGVAVIDHRGPRERSRAGAAGNAKLKEIPFHKWIPCYNPLNCLKDKSLNGGGNPGNGCEKSKISK